MDPDSRSTSSGRRIGRAALLEAAADLLVAPRAAELGGGVVGVRRVAEAAGVAPATVNHHFRPSGGGRNERLVVATIRHALTRTGMETSRRVAASAADVIDALRAGEPDAVRRLAHVAADDILAWSPETPAEEETDAGRIRRSRSSAVNLGTVMASANGEIRQAMIEHYDELVAVWSLVYEEVLEATERRLIGDLTTLDMATTLAALADGFILRRSFDPAAASPELFGEVTIRLFEALTSPRTAAEDRDPSDILVPLPTGSHLDGHKRAAIARAAGAVYASRGWEGLTVSAVVAESGVSRRTVTAHFGDRSGLAAAVWSRFVADLATALENDVELVPARSLVRHLERMAGIAGSHRPLSGALLEGMLRHSMRPLRPQRSDPTDPEALAPLALVLQPTVEAAASAFRPGHADSPANARQTARHLTTVTIGLACERPEMTAGDIATYVADTTLAGMLRRRPGRSR